jgi:hypothetical protein
VPRLVSIKGRRVDTNAEVPHVYLQRWGSNQPKVKVAAHRHRLRFDATIAADLHLIGAWDWT